MLRQYLGNTGRARHTEGQRTGPCFYQQRVRVSVVAALKFNDFVASGCPAGEPNCTHSRLGARACHSHLLERWHQRAKTFGEFDLDFCGATKAESVLSCFNHGCPDSGVVVAHDHGSPGQDVVDVAFLVYVIDVGALRPLHEARCAADCLKGTHWRVNTTRYWALSSLKQLF